MMAKIVKGYFKKMINFYECSTKEFWEIYCIISVIGRLINCYARLQQKVQGQSQLDNNANDIHSQYLVSPGFIISDF